MRRTVIAALAAALYLPLSAQAQDREAKIKNALSAAPAGLVEDASVMDWDNTELRAGTSGWTCFPDPPQQTGNNPMCLDAQWVKWAAAWADEREKPEVTGIGIAYMLQGGNDASNTDPFATEPAPGEDWVESGPHLMIILPDVEALKDLPTDPYSGGPWVMWQGTPYAHIMIPVGK
jgi:hypothetical protein